MRRWRCSYRLKESDVNDRSFIYQYRKVRSTVERKVDVEAFKVDDVLSITSSKVILANGDLLECDHTSIELPHDDAIRLRDYLNRAYPLEGITPIKSLACLDGTILGERQMTND